jgi:hypothetical protein
MDPRNSRENPSPRLPYPPHWLSKSRDIENEATALFIELSLSILPRRKYLVKNMEGNGSLHFLISSFIKVEKYGNSDPSIRK